MTKHTKGVIYSDVFENINTEAAYLLRKCNNGKTFGVMKSNEKEKLWGALLNIITSKNVQETNIDNTQTIKVCLEAILGILSMNPSNVEKSSTLVSLVKYLNSDEFSMNSSAIVNNVSRLNEYWMTKLESMEVISGMEYYTLKHLLNLCTCEKPTVSDLNRLSSIRKFISGAPFEKAVPSLKPLLIKLVQNSTVLGSDHGQRFISQSLLLSQKLMTDIHKTIMLDLNFCITKKAVNYGKVYVMSWHSASEEMKKSLEKFCFEHLMETFLKEHRVSLELSKNSQNLLAVLEIWHAERKKKDPQFTTMITNVYQPILWKYFQSCFNMHRCNAADVFFKAFPLQRSTDNAVEAEKLFSMQYEAMVASLTDDCHIVRIIGIREVCNIISHYWNSFTPLQIQNLLKIIAKQNACDASTAEVRKMVYIGFQSLVNSPLSCDYMKQLLPLLANNIHDVNQKVRIAFIQLLICIKDKKDPNFKYSDVVSMGHIQYRLADDNAAVGQWIVKLLIRNYYHSKMPVVEWTKRFIYLIKTYRKSYRNFFFYSSKCLAFPDACTIIYEILSQLGGFVLSKSLRHVEDSENIKEKPKEKKKGNKKIPLSDCNGRKESMQANDTIQKKCAFDDPDVVLGLFDIVTILWVLHDTKLNKPENEDVRFKLYDTYIKYAQPFINYYKDCNLFLCVITLSGNIPASLLRNNSITLPGYCIKMLKSINVNRSSEDDEKIISMLMALVKWGRGSEILEQVTLWLDAAFETQNLNETILPRRRVKINEAIQPNSVVAVNILDILMKKEYAKLSILKKNYSELFQLWKFMSRVRQLIETRLELGEPFTEELVSDHFLALCFQRYVKLIPLLKENEGNEDEKKNGAQNESKDEYINHQKEIENVIEWAENLFYPLLQDVELEEIDLDLISSVLGDVLYVSDNMMLIHLVNNAFYFKVAHFALKLLSTKYGVYFVRACSRIAVVLNQSGKLLLNGNDDLKLFSTVIPSLLSHCLKVLIKDRFSPNEMEKIEKDLPSTKTYFCKILATYQDNLKTTSNLREKVRHLKLIVGLFVDCIVQLISREIPREDFSLLLYSSPVQLPPIASTLVTLFFNKKTWSPLFIHVLKTRLSPEIDDVKITVSCILLLHMYAAGDKKVESDELKKAVSVASKALSDMKKSSNIDKSTICDSSAATGIPHKETLTNISVVVSNKSTGIQNNVSEEALLPDEDECHENESIFAKEPQKIMKFLPSRDPQNNLNGDLIDCGLELIENILNILKSRPTNDS